MKYTRAHVLRVVHCAVKQMTGEEKAEPLKGDHAQQQTRKDFNSNMTMKSRREEATEL